MTIEFLKKDIDNIKIENEKQYKKYMKQINYYYNFY